MLHINFRVSFSGLPDFGDNSSSSHVYEMVAYDKNGLKIIFFLKLLAGASNTTTINMEARNNTALPISEFLFQVAVPKVRVLLFFIIGFVCNE